jgi:hypothetical protein
VSRRRLGGGAPGPQFEFFFATAITLRLHLSHCRAMHFGARVIVAHTALITHTGRAGTIQAACIVKFHAAEALETPRVLG